MANYGQYNLNQQVGSEEASDALEQSIFDSDHLLQQFRDELAPLLQEAELRLDETGFSMKFKNVENKIKTHVNRWYRLTKNFSEMALKFRSQTNHIFVKLDSLKNEIEERDKIIRTQRKDFENEKDQYENQLKVLESALAGSVPRNKTLSKYQNITQTNPNAQIEQLTKDRNAQEQQYQKLKIENQRLKQNIKILNSGSNDYQQTLTNLNNEIAKKEDEILSLRWLTQDLAAERNGLEQKIQSGVKDPNFTSVTPQREMNYDIDLSAFLDGDEDVSDDAAENGMLYLEMNDDAGVNPQVVKKLAEALEAVKKVTEFANDRDYEAKQLESRRDEKEKEEQQKDEVMDMMQRKDTDEETKDESSDRVGHLPKKYPDIKAGDSHDDIVVGRRKSLLAFGQQFENEAKRRSKTFQNQLQKEDRRRSRHSSNRRRRSSVSNLPIGLLPIPDSGDLMSKSDIGGYTLEQEALHEEDKALLNSLRRSVKALPITTRADSTAPSPAPSPRNSPHGQANSPIDEVDLQLNLDDAVDDDDIHTAAAINIGVAANEALESREKERERLKLQELNRMKDRDLQLLTKQIDDKAQLIRDLKTNLRELSENRRRELLHFQQQLETMKSRCREWYEQLMSRVREMESMYQEKIAQEVNKKQGELHRELNEERRRMKDAFEQQLAAAAKQDSNPHEIDELSREIARLNEDLEKFKGKYFDSEQQKIELSDALDEIKEEKFKMEEKLDELAAKVAMNEEMRENDVGLHNNNAAAHHQMRTSHHRKSTDEWNDLVQKLREEKENQEAQYEEEFREFERMANEKVVQLEEYYVQQLQMKEVHVQQLQQQLQQQILAKQQQQTIAIDQQTMNQLNERISGLNTENTKLNGEVTKLSQENSKLSAEISKLTYQHSHDRDQLIQLKKKNDNNESKISAYNASFIELAEKLKQLNDDTKSLRKEKDKKQRKLDKLEKSKKKLKQEIKDLNEKIENITAVTKELVNLKHKTIRQTEQWEKERGEYDARIHRLEQEMMQNTRKKIESINRYNVEMNNLRTNIKTLQGRVVFAESECDKLRETDSQSVLGSAANWVPTNWWNTKK